MGDKINEIENRKKTENNKENKASFFEKIKRIDKPLVD